MMTTSGDTSSFSMESSFSSPSSDVASKNAPKFSLENYEKLLSDFLYCSNTYQQQALNRSQLEQTCAQLFPKIWTMTDQQRNILVPDQSVQPPQSISLAYKFQIMQFSEAAFGEFCGVSNHVVDCMSGPYLNSYYQQLTSQQTLLYYVMDHLRSSDDDDDASDKKEEDDFYEQLLRVTMRSIQMERSQQQQQMRTNNGLTVLQELTIFICKLWMTSIEKQRTTGSSMNGTLRQQHQPEEETLFMDDIRPALLDTLVEQQLDDDDFLLMDNEVQPIPLQRTTSTASPKREMARGLLVSQLLPLILEYDAIDYLHVVLQPTTQQVVEEKLFEVLLTEQNVNRLSGSQIIKIMNQFPVHDLSRCYSEKDENDVVQVKESILDPLKNALNLIASVQNHNLLLLSHVAKLILFFVSEFPSLALDGLMALTRAKWPSKMVAHTVLTLFPWDKLPEDIQDACVTEMYNVYCRTIDSLADNEQVAHLNDYCNKFLIPYASIVRSVYQIDSVIASMNKNVEYPIFVAFRKLAETAFSNAHYSIGDLIVSILFGFCFKSGTTISSHLVSLGKIRVESSNELASLCIHSSYAFSNVLNDIVKSLGMLLQTQPLITDQICALIQKSISQNYLLNDGAIVSMRGLLSSVRSPTFITEPSIRIFKTIVENVPWKKQSQAHVLDVLDLILYNSTINPDIRQWAVRLLSGSVGGCMTSVSQVSLAEEFIIKHNSTNDEVVTALCLLISLGVCSFKLDQSKLYDEQYQLWQQCVSELRILEMLENANDSPFLVTIIQKYVGCLAAFFGNDAQKFIPVAAHTLSKYLRDLNNIPAVLSLISACAVSNSTKDIEIWSLLLLETLFSGSNCSIVLDQMIKYHYCHKLDMTPIIESVKSKQSSNMNPSLTINNLIHANQYWTAYAYLSALEVQMPPVIDRASNDGELVGSVQLSTDIDCAMWISVECAFKAAQRNSHIISLIFWQYFFNLYFQLEERYGSNIFPRYLMDRYNNQISNQLSAIPPDHPASSVLRTLYTWDRTKCGSGHCLDDSLLVILDNNSARPTTFNGQPSANAVCNQPPPSTRLPPVPSHMVGSMSASNYMTNSMTNSYISPPVSPPLSQIQQVGVLKPMDMSLTRINTPMVNVQVQQSEETEITKVSMLIAQPLPIPTNSLVKDRTRYDSIKKMMHSVLHQSTDSELLLELPDDMTGEHGSVSDDHSVKFCAFVKRLLSNYVSALKKWSDLTSEYLAYTKATYVNAPGTTIATATSARGITIPVSVPISTIQLVEPDVVNKMNNNRHAGSTLQKTLHEITENLSLIGTVVHQLSVVLENDSSKQHLGRVIVFELLSDMLDMNTAQKLGAIWSYYAKNLAAIGRSCVTKVPDVQQPLLDLLISAPALPTTTLPVMVVQPKRDFQQQIVSAIANVVKPVINALQPRPSVTTYSPPPNYAQTTQQSLRPTTPMQPIQSPQPPNYQVSHQRMNQSHVGNAGLNSERMLLFSMFEPNILLRCGRREEFALLMSIVAETDTKLSLEEVGYLCSRFDLVEFFRELETYPEGKRFTSRDDIKLLLKTLKSALCKPHLQKMFGNKLLRNCARLAFPYETVSFLRMILTLCRSGEYTGNDWPDLLVSQEELSKVSIELCITWINIINEYQPLSGVCAEGCLNFVYRIVTQTALASYMDRCDIHADAVNSIVNFFEAFVSTRTDKLQDSLFQQMLSMLFAVIKSCPAFVDRLWTLYNGSLYPYVATAPPASITALTTFMKNVNWSTSVFHINNMEVLDELFHALIQNVEVASHVISQLNWNFVMRSETTSAVICKVARLYIALEFFNISSILPPHIRAFFEKLDQYEVPTPVWQRVTPSDFAAAFSDRLLFKLLVSSKLPTDPSDAYMKIVYWMTEISLSLNHVATAEAIASEVRSTMFTVLKSAGQDRTWYLTSKQLSNVLMHCLIPLAIKFASNTLIMYVLSTLRECEKGVTSIVIPQNMPFAIGDCPFDNSSSAMRSEKHQALLEKFKNIIIHFATSANEKLAHTILGCILMLDLHLDTQVIVLEYTVRSLLKLSTSQHPRHAAANALQLPPHMILYSSSFNLLLERCIDTYSALALAVLIHKLLDVTLQVSGNNSEAVTNGYIYAMDYILKFVPHPSREDFDIIYVYFLALEMIDSQYWDLNNSFVRERVQKFDDVLTCLSQKYAKTLTQRLTTTNNSQKLKECKISPATCLAARAVRVYMEEITRSKQLTTQPHVQARSSMYANLTGNYGSNNYFTNMLKLKERKEFASFQLFFDRCGALLQHIDHEQFRELISLLFPLVPYMHRV